MLYGEKSREELNAHAEELFKKEMSKKEKRNLYDEVYQKYGISVDVVEQMITFKRNISEFTPFEVFAVVWFLDRDCLSKYYTEGEIEFMSNEKIVEETVTLPIEFDNMVQIAADQWIGKITVQELMKLKKARLINYEEGEQRGYKRMKSGSMEIWKPFVSNKNVKEIKESMERGEYIPDPMTLNMPEGSVFKYNSGTLTVISMPKGMFNLDDGYHRYLAMSQIYDFDQSFDYPMELRLVNFSNSKANRFIYQQDQKTQMRKVLSDSYNPDALPNKIVNFIKNDSGCYVSSMIGRNGASINEAVLAKLINHYFITSPIKREDEMSFVLKTKNDLKQKFNAIAEQNEIFLRKYPDDLLMIVMHVFASETEMEKYADTIISIYSSITETDKQYIGITPTGHVRRKGVKLLNEKLKEVQNV